MSQPNFFSEGSSPRRPDTLWKIEQKILGALADGAGGGGGGGAGQVVAYTSGTPADPADTALPAMAYDPNGVLPTLGWNTGTLTWN